MKIIFSFSYKRILDEFFTLLKEPFSSWRNPDSIEIRGDKVYYVPEKDYENKGIHFLRNGVYLGDLKKNRFEPSQPFALVLTGEAFSNCMNFRQDDERLDAYLRGETLLIDDFVDSRSQGQDGKNLKNGWVLILVEGYPIGFGKRSGNLVKNKYPAGWRRR